jgi:hypothetical protein
VFKITNISKLEAFLRCCITIPSLLITEGIFTRILPVCRMRVYSENYTSNQDCKVFLSDSDQHLASILMINDNDNDNDLTMYVCVYVCRYVFMYACMYVCMNICMYIYECIYVCVCEHTFHLLYVIFVQFLLLTVHVLQVISSQFLLPIVPCSTC